MTDGVAAATEADDRARPRGPAAGGEPEAHVVYFRDEWPNFADVLEPLDVLANVAAPEPHEDRGTPRIVVWSTTQRIVSASTRARD